MDLPPKMPLFAQGVDAEIRTEIQTMTINGGGGNTAGGSGRTFLLPYHEVAAQIYSTALNVKNKTTSLLSIIS